MLKKQKINIIIVVLATLLVSYFILKDDFLDIVNLITKMNLWWLALAILMVAIYWFFQTLCLSNLSLYTEKPKFRILFKSTIICNFFSAITPSATGGQPFQIYYLKNNGLQLGTASNIVIEQSTLYQIALVLFGMAAIILNYFFDFFPSDSLLKRLVLIGFAINVLVIALLAFISFGKKSNKFIVVKLINFLSKIKIIRHKEKVLEKVEKTVDNFYVSAKALNGNKVVLIKGIIYNFIGLAFLYATPLVVSYAFGNYSMGIMTVLAASAYVMLIGAFVPIPGGTGGIEYAFATFFGFYLKDATLMAVLLIWRFVTYYLSILIGGLVLILDRDGGN